MDNFVPQFWTVKSGELALTVSATHCSDQLGAIVVVAIAVCSFFFSHFLIF